MGYREVLTGFFEEVLREEEFVERLTRVLENYGFRPGNTILGIAVCRDEISQPLVAKIRAIWGEVFNLSSLGALFIAGKTALLAAMHHSPIESDRERYVFMSFPHIAIDAQGRLGICKRVGRPGESSACGALVSFLGELKNRMVKLSHDPLDMEQNFLRMRLLRELPYGHLPDLLELTKKVREISLRDLEEALSSCVEPQKGDYAIISGIQIHGPDENFLWIPEAYVVVGGKRQNITFHS